MHLRREVHFVRVLGGVKRVKNSAEGRASAVVLTVGSQGADRAPQRARTSGRPGLLVPVHLAEASSVREAAPQLKLSLRGPKAGSRPRVGN